MGRVKEQSRGRLAALQEILTGGGKALVDQAQSLGAGVQRRLAEVGRGVESQVTTLIGGSRNGYPTAWTFSSTVSRCR